MAEKNQKERSWRRHESSPLMKVEGEEKEAKTHYTEGETRCHLAPMLPKVKQPEKGD